MIRLVASDLDGTLLGPDQTISRVNRAAIAAAAEAGVLFVVATGRPLRWLGVLDAVAEAHPLVIVSNGAGLYDLAGRRLLRSSPLAPDTVAAVADDLRRAIPGVSLALERGDVFGCEPTSRSLFVGSPETLVAPWEILVDRITPAVKMIVYHDDIRSEELARRASEVAGGRVAVTHSLTHDRFGMLELSAPGVTKATALAALCAELGIDASEVVAIGDMPNDAQMLAWAGRGLVMANGHPDLKRRFAVIGPNTADGVGHALVDLLRANRDQA